MALSDALIALDRHDLTLADKVVRGDLEINRLRYQVEEQITPRLAGSEAADARWMVAALYVISELERMGDHAEGIANVTLMLGHLCDALGVISHSFQLRDHEEG